MRTDFYTFEMLTGRRLTPLPVSTGSWKLTTNADETMSCSIPSRAAVTRKLDIWGSTTLARNGLLVTVDDEPVAAGPLWKRSYKQGGTIDLTAGGIRSYWERRLLLPARARTTPLVNGEGDPDTSLDTNLSGLSYGTIVKRYIELGLSWPGGNIPMQLPPDEAGTREKNVAAIDLKTIKKMIEDVQNLEAGPDVAFRPRWHDDGLGIYWELQTGTNAQPRLGNPDPDLIRWTVGAPTGGAHSLSVSEDGTAHTEEVFASGGGSADRVIVAHAKGSKLSAAGFPLLQSSNTGHNDVKLEATMQNYADQDVHLGAYASSFWSMSVRANEKGTPKLGDYWLGDKATVTVDAREPVLPAGDFPRRIASIAGKLGSEDLDLVFAEAIA